MDDENEREASRQRLFGWLAFVVSPIIGIIAMLIIYFFVFQNPLPF